MGEHFVRVAGTVKAAGGVGRLRAEIVGFLAEALSERGTRLFVASPFWSSPNLLTRAASAAAAWKGRLADTTIVTATERAARRIVQDLRPRLPWHPSVWVCPGLHAKLVLVEGGRTVRALIGSANMTSAGTRRPLEAMIQIEFTPESAAGSGVLALRDAIREGAVSFRETKAAI